jgi:hypothetical protein
MLAISFAVVLLILLPQVGQALWKMLDLRVWSRMVCMSLNVLVLLCLLLIRFSPHINPKWRNTDGIEVGHVTSTHIHPEHIATSDLRHD